MRRRNLQRLRRARQFLVLVAEERPTAEAGEAGGQASASSSVAAEAAAEPEPEAAAPGPGPGSAACATGAAASAAAYGGARRRGQAVAAASLSLLQPEALLPPPFPSNKPYRLYVSNMSVVPAHRRRGLAKRLLLQCERVGKRDCVRQCVEGEASTQPPGFVRGGALRAQRSGLVWSGPKQSPRVVWHLVSERTWLSVICC